MNIGIIYVIDILSKQENKDEKEGKNVSDEIKELEDLIPDLERKVEISIF